MNELDDEVVRLLQTSGERWRAADPELTDLDISGLLRHGRAPRRTFGLSLRNVATLTTALVGVAVLALIFGSLPNAIGPAGPAPTPSASAPTPSASASTASPTPEPSSCCTHGPTAWPGGISQAEAQQRALALVPTSGSAAPVVVWAAFEFDPFVPGGTPDRKPVWEVRLAGAIAAPTCAPGYLDRAPSTADPLCLDWSTDTKDIPGVIVVLDYYDGSLIGWLH